MSETRPWATNPLAHEWSGPEVSAPALAFHRSMPGYAATPLDELPGIAAAIGVARLWVKDESDRFSLPAFKALGASWAANCAISSKLGLAPARTQDELAARAGGTGITLVTATDGNHGRALAHVARRVGATARIYVAGGLPHTTVQAIRDEGAAVIETERIYDDAVRMAADSIGANDLLVQDTAWPGYEDIPRAIVDGYTTLFAEIDEQHPSSPGLIVVPTGVGSLLQAAIEHSRHPGREERPAILAVEPTTAACVTASLAAGRPVSVDTSAPTTMGGLNCGTVSSIAWPTLEAGLSAAVGVTDEETESALNLLSEAGVAAGPCGAAALAGLRAAPLALDPSTDVVLISTEGAAANQRPAEGPR